MNESKQQITQARGETRNPFRLYSTSVLNQQNVICVDRFYHQWSKMVVLCTVLTQSARNSVTHVTVTS